MKTGVDLDLCFVMFRAVSFRFLFDPAFDIGFEVGLLVYEFLSCQLGNRLLALRSGMRCFGASYSVVGQNRLQIVF